MARMEIEATAGPSYSEDVPETDTGVQSAVLGPAASEHAGPEPESQAEESEVTDKNSENEAARSAVMESLRRFDTYMLQNGHALAGLMPILFADRHEDGIFGCVSDSNELKALARPTIESRMRKEREYLKRLRKECVEQYGHVWESKISPPGSINDRYEKWLEAGDGSASAPRDWGVHRDDWSLIEHPSNGDPRACVNRSSPDSIYATELSPLADCGALVLSNPSLQLMCESGNHLHISPATFIGHFCPELYIGMEGAKSKCAKDIKTRAFYLSGRMVALPESVTNLVFHAKEERIVNSKFVTEAGQVHLSAILIRDSFVLMMLSILERGSSSTIPAKAAVLPCNSNTEPLHLISDFFVEKWRCQKLFALWSGLPLDLNSNTEYLIDVFLWQWAVWLYEIKIKNVSRNLQGIDYESVTLSPHEALNRVKFGRARVAQLRKNLASTKEVVYSFVLREAYRNERKNVSTVQQASKDTNLAPRQLAASSIEDEYQWLDKHAADLMPKLNEYLQVVIATLNVEQSQVALKDAEVSRRNGERSTQLTLLAAIYLPLTLATGIFGMNIKDVNGDEVRYWWPIILAIVLMIPSAVVIAYIFWRSRQDRRRERERLDKGEKEA